MPGSFIPCLGVLHLLSSLRQSRGFKLLSRVAARPALPGCPPAWRHSPFSRDASARARERPRPMAIFSAPGTRPRASASLPSDIRDSGSRRLITWSADGPKAKADLLENMIYAENNTTRRNAKIQARYSGQSFVKSNWENRLLPTACLLYLPWGLSRPQLPQS
jgi:hypothetical protein